MHGLLRRIASSVATAMVVIAASGVVRATEDAPAEPLIQAAVAARLGEGVDVTVLAVDVPARAGLPVLFRQARLDPNAFLGKPMRVALVTGTGFTVNAVATVRVVGPHVVMAREVQRGETVTAEHVRVEREELKGLPLRHLLSSTQVVGARALRSMAEGSTVLPGSVVTRRAVEAGDKVTAVVASGEVEIRASLVAADGGDPGDVIRVVNPETRRDLRGRVLKEGVVEVQHAR